MSLPPHRDARDAVIHPVIHSAGLIIIGAIAIAGLSTLLQASQPTHSIVNLHAIPTSTTASAPLLSHSQVHKPASVEMHHADYHLSLPSRRSTMILQGAKNPTQKDGPFATVFLAISAFFGGFILTNFWKGQASKSSMRLEADSRMAAVSAAPTYKLRYFDARGVAEVSRLLFAIAGVPYEDFRYKFTFGKPGDMSTISMPEFQSDKANGTLAPNMGRLPILEVNGVPIGQSKAIERYLAKQFGFMGDNEIEAAKIDTMCEHVRDIKDGYRKLLTIKDETEKQAALSKWYSEDLPSWCKRLEHCIGPDRWAVGSKFSLADLNIWALLADTFNNQEAANNAYKECPRLKTICAAVAGMAGVQNWLQKRPPTMM